MMNLYLRNSKTIEAKRASRRHGLFGKKIIYPWEKNKGKSLCRLKNLLKNLDQNLEVGKDYDNENDRNSLRPVTLLKKRLWHRCFPVNFAKFLRAPFL